MKRINLITAFALLLISSSAIAMAARESDFLGLDSFGTDDFLTFDAAMAPEAPLAPSPESETPLPPEPDTPAAPTTPSPPETPLLPPSTPQTPPLLPPATPQTPPLLPPATPQTPPLLPPATPQTPPFLPPTIPSTPETPLPPAGNSCDEKCAKKCPKIPFIFNICFKTCMAGCNLLHEEQTYNCTNKCAKSMPAGLHSDKEKMGSYVNSCYQKCKSYGVF
ncbi:hypothetical protein CCACVL1_28016 [Corchorus capsularis]|uniref:Uncharacterized protein n=1 Tax=Corchorus capsularis TaxID=210143 RepID=A0A1R3G7S3_COCAP|nr:hypothetical protein CCACVL1_28016 [Corchorus capsularis]